MFAAMMVACASHPDVPQNAQQVNAQPSIFPDYTEVTMPSNICPPDFMANGDAEEMVARLSVGDKSFTYGEGVKAIIDPDEWAELRDAATKGANGGALGAVKVETFAKEGDAWKAYKPFSIFIAPDSIDPYVSYRIIQPSYVSFEDLSIAQRCLENFDQTDIYNNKLDQTEDNGQCINCHSYQNYKTDNMLFHIRINHGGTIIVTGDQMKKVNLKTDSTISAGVYPAWHPTEQLIAFSTNNTQQAFFTKDKNKIEVFDTGSDLILYDIQKNTVSNISNDSTEFECFPTWSPDGKTLYYTSAHFEYAPNDTTDHVKQVMERYKDLKYNIYRRSFDAATHQFGPQQLVFDAAALGKSATLPRVSPDGRYLVFSLGGYGCFHVWHADADIYLLDLAKAGDGNAAQDSTAAAAQIVNLSALNSNLSESYPSFSSNGRWIMTDSRRDDGNYTRPYISYFDKQGKCHKAFEIPQQDPEYNTLLLRSYNRPEFMKEPVKVSPQALANKIKDDPEKVDFK